MVNIKALMTLWIRDWFKLFEHRKNKIYLQMGHYKKLEYEIVNIEKPQVNLFHWGSKYVSVFVPSFIENLMDSNQFG